jgi:hypothetical protein
LDHPSGEILILGEGIDSMSVKVLGVGKRAIAVFKEYHTAVTVKIDVG